jgi:non-specific serine/threonine protein kinase
VSVARLAGRHDVDLTSFVGRKDALAEGRRLLGGARLVTFVGPGGVGKTRLARRLADEVSRAFPDGTYLVELAELQDPDALATELVGTLGVEVITRTHEAAVAAYVRDRRLLLVLDGCEHLAEACSRLVHTLLLESSGLRILATSRQPLGVTGEQLMSVEPLSLPSPDDVRRDGAPDSEAVELFVDRARLVLPGFELTESNAELAGRLCTVLEGMPLAIELAAARLRVLTLAQLADRLHDRFGLLKGGATASLPRHQTLRASVDWSFDLCSPEEQRLWTWMSVFEGGADLDAIEAVCAGTGVDVFDSVAGLVDKSVLAPQEVAGRVRYRMLDTIRAYGRERLVDRGEADELTARHRAYFVEFAGAAGRSWFGPGQRDLLARTMAEHANLRTAFDACLASPDTYQDALVITTSIGWYWLSQGAVDESIGWSDRALAAQHEPSALTLQALSRASVLAAVWGDPQAMLTRAEAVIALPCPDESEASRSARRLARTTLAAAAGDIHGALDNERQGLADEALLDRLGPEEVVNVLMRLVVLLAGTGRPAEALEHIDEGTRICIEHGEEWYLSFLHHLRGARLVELGLPQDALDAEREALRLGRGGFDAYTVANALLVVVQIYLSLGEGDKAAMVCGALSCIWPRLGAPPLEGSVPGAAPDELMHEVRTRELVGEEAYAVAFARGRRMTAEDVVSLVLDEREPTPAAATPRLDDVSALTKREEEVARLVARGLSNKEIAEALVISPRTAEGHVARLLDKLGFTTRARVAAWVAERGAGGP